jgi:hypothetical protein
MRKNKLTASMFGPVINAMVRRLKNPSYKIPDSLFNQLQSNYNLDKVKVHISYRLILLYIHIVNNSF